MSDFFGNESVFKKPAVPSRYQRTNFGNNSAYIHGGSNITNNSGNAASKLKERIEIFEKLFPQSDNIWENLVQNVDQLFFIKIREQVNQPSRQQSLFNGGSTCASTCSQIIRSAEKARNNFTQTTNNVQDYLRSQNCQRSNLRNELSLSTQPESEQVERHPSRLHNVFPAPRVQEYELPEHIRSTMLQNPCQTSGQVKYQKSRSRDAALGLENISHFSRKPDQSSCESRIVRKLNAKKSSSRQHKEKIPENEDPADASDEYEHDASNSRVSVPTVAKRSSKNRISESTLEVKLKKPQSVELAVPAVSKKQSRKQEPVANALQAKNATFSNVRSSQKKNEESVKIIRDTSGRSSISTRSSIRKNDAPCKSSRELIVLNSEDENDSLAAFFNKKKKLTAKKTTASTSAVPPVTRVNNPSIQQDNKRKREISQLSEEESESEKDDFQSAESDVSQPEQATEIPTKKNARVSRKAVRKNVNNNKANHGSKNNAVLSQNKDNISTEDIIEENLVPPVKEKLKQAVDNSFFGEVSSILENEDVSLLRIDKRKGRNKRFSENDTSMPFLSPFAPGNSRSTSVFSAISTPLSKSASKNVMGKRIKKPNVVAELKGELKRRKKQDNKTKAKPIEPVLETTATTESECEVSDFSDD